MKLILDTPTSIFDDFKFDYQLARSFNGWKHNATLTVTHKDLPIVFAFAEECSAGETVDLLSQRLMFIALREIELASKYGKSGLPASVFNNYKGFVYFPQYDANKKQWFVLNYEGSPCYKNDDLTAKPVVEVRDKEYYPKVTSPTNTTEETQSTESV